MSAMPVRRVEALERRLRGPVPRPPFGGRLFYPALLLLFGNGIAAAAIYGGNLHAKTTAAAWFQVIIGEVLGIVAVTLLPRRIFLVRVRRLTLNFAMAVPLLGGYLGAAVAGVFPALGIVFGGIAAVMFWTVHPSSVRHLVRRVEREQAGPQ
jgi:hypothetical protein